METAADNSKPQRKSVGRPFEKGKSPNPGGRPKGYAELRAAARKHTKKALQTLVNALDDPKLCVVAAQALLDRGYGKPSQPIEGADGEPLRVSIAIDLGGK